MPIDVLMPSFAADGRSGKLTKWLVAEGDEVQAGDVIAEIETENETIEIEAVDSGRVVRILVRAGTSGVVAKTAIARLATGRMRQSGAVSRHAVGDRTGANRSDALPTDGVTGDDAAPAGRVLASPLARRLAREAGIRLEDVAASGPGGRIIKRDIEAFRPPAAASSATNSAYPETPHETHHLEPSDQSTTSDADVDRRRPAPNEDRASSTCDDDGNASEIAVRAVDAPPSEWHVSRFPVALNRAIAVVPHKPLTRALAAKLTAAAGTIPHLDLDFECRMDEVIRARNRMNGAPPVRLQGGRDGGYSRHDVARRPEPPGPNLTFTVFLVKALALALQQVPEANAAWTETARHQFGASDVGVAIASDYGTLTPVIHDAELKSLSDIAAEIEDLAAAVRRGSLDPRTCVGGATSIANLGMFGISKVRTIVSPPHATLLAVGAVEERPVVIAGALSVAAMMSCTLSCDRRLVDGAVAARLVASLRAYIEEPLRMLV
ncbi:MAG: 2-oxo acid dehydrogenase subunit E2 [Hyphomicrobiaceae bacterium]|nr:2-oxo acid dehydrogenase subunit E2 [Hyphomicrobiaceae bacterium]